MLTRDISGMATPKRNMLLDAMPRDAYSSIAHRFETVALERGVVLHEPGQTIDHLYFPIDCLVSITVTSAEGKTVETGACGNREVVGVNAFMGGRETTQTKYNAQVAGRALKIEAEPLKDAFNENRSMRDVLLKYTQAFIAQISQNAACNRLHGLEQRYARWLLETRDRVQTDDIQLTQEFMSEMLGVQRPSVSLIAGEFQKRGLITITRGLTRIVDASGVASLSCGCFQVLADEYDRLLGLRDCRGSSPTLPSKSS